MVRATEKWFFPTRGDVALALACAANTSRFAFRTLHVGVIGAAGASGRKAPHEAYIRALARSKIIVTCNPTDWEGDSRLGEALSSGALVCVDLMLDPPPGLIDGRTTLFYRSTAHLLERIEWALHNVAAANAIADAGRRSVRTPSQLVDALAAAVVREASAALQPPLSVVYTPAIAPSQCRTASCKTLLDGLRGSGSVELKQGGGPSPQENAPSGAGLGEHEEVALSSSSSRSRWHEVAIIDLWHEMLSCSHEKRRVAACFSRRLEQQLALHRGRTIVGLDWSDSHRLLPSPVVANTSAIHILFKRSRVHRAARALASYPRPVLPLHYPVKANVLSALAPLASQSRAMRPVDVSAFFTPPSTRHCPLQPAPVL